MKRFHARVILTGMTVLEAHRSEDPKGCPGGCYARLYCSGLSTPQIYFSHYGPDIVYGNTTDALKVKRQSSLVVGTVPYGWDAVETGNTRIKRVAGQDVVIKERRMVDNLEEQAWLRHMDQLLKGGLSFAKIANDMNRRGLKTKFGNDWNFGGVKKILVGDDDATRPTAAREWLDRLTAE